jgi:hypothetical protein
MFTTEYRARLRAELLEYAARDERLSGGAVTGSAAMNREDRWSDIDLAFAVADGSRVVDVLSDFTTFMYDRHGALFHQDVPAGAWIYRVFFLPGTLQVDLAFVAQSEFRPLGPTFRLVFGEANAAHPFPAPAAKDIIGMAWLHALHARTCILRGKFWQAEYMISAVRDHVMTLACIRHGLPYTHGRGMDQLPGSVTTQLLGSLVRELQSDELWRALGVAVQSLVAEVDSADGHFDERILADLIELSAKPPTNL